MAASKHVSFQGTDDISYFNDPSCRVDLESVRHSTHRSLLEKQVHHNPHNELERVKQIIAAWRTSSTFVVFGNLGRQPHLLNYFLDLCIRHDETVRVVCRWDIPIAYRDRPPLDFLIVVEPHFGYTVHKPPDVQHLIVFSSHLYMNTPTCTKFYCLHLSSQKVPDPPQQHVPALKSFHPPLFHDTPIQLHKHPVVLDLTPCSTAHEAYLRFLTGREICCQVPVQIAMNERDAAIIRDCAIRTKERFVFNFEDNPSLSKIYWDFFLQNDGQFGPG